MPKNYRPEIDVTPVLNEKNSSLYMQYIGMLRWAIELGRVDILLEVSLLSSYMCMPREGQLEAIYCIFGYLAKHLEAPLIFDARYPTIDETVFTNITWKYIYPDAKEDMHPRTPEPRGRPVVMTAFVDADHAGNLVTRHSHTGFIIYLNRSPIDWYSKR
jgi:hypothetical protein